MDIFLAAITFTGTYDAFMAGVLFRGNLIMERIGRFATIAFGIVAFFSVFDLILTSVNSSLLWFVSRLSLP